MAGLVPDKCRAFVYQLVHKWVEEGFYWKHRPELKL